MRPSDRLKKYDSVITIHTTYGEVPMYKFIEKFLYISDKKGEIRLLILNEDQVTFYEEMCKERLKGRPIRINCLKSRRKGISTFIAAIIFCSVTFRAGQNAAILADIAEHATILFNIYKFFYSHLPKELQLETLSSNAKELIFKHSNNRTSTIRIMVQGDAAGRGGTYQYLHLSECAFWDDLENTLISLLQTVEYSNKDSMVFLETTANGFNEYKKTWDFDVANYGGKGRYMPLFLAWFTDSTCVKPDDEITITYDDLSDIEKDVMKAYNLTLNQMAWYDEKLYVDCKGNILKLKQEYPSNAVEAFLTSGNSVFNSDLVAERKNALYGKLPLRQGLFSYEVVRSQDGNSINVNNIKWANSTNGIVKIYEEVNPLHPYVVCMDTSNGGSDYYATVVFDNYTCHQVAVLHINKTDYEFPTFQTYCLAKMYNNALLTAECNTPTGTLALQTCYKAGYRFIYKDSEFENISTRFMDKYGYKTKTTNRDAMIQLFAEAFKENSSIINDYETIVEMEAFQYVQVNKKRLDEKAQATGGNHDDLVMSICGFFLCRNQQQAIPFKEPMKEEETFVYDPYEYHKKLEEQQSRRNVYQLWD